MSTPVDIRPCFSQDPTPSGEPQVKECNFRPNLDEIQLAGGTVFGCTHPNRFVLPDDRCARKIGEEIQPAA
jgi:hypothetical protein